MGRELPIGLLGMALVMGAVTGTTASAAEDLAVSLEVHRVVTFEDGSEALEEAATARPGDLLEYRVTYTNGGRGEVRQLQAVLPIPLVTEYVEATAEPARVEASLDGVSFAPAPLVRKIVREDGSESWVPVPTSEYRALRWAVGDLRPEESVSVRARVRVPLRQTAAR